MVFLSSKRQVLLLGSLVFFLVVSPTLVRAQELEQLQQQEVTFIATDAAEIVSPPPAPNENPLSLTISPVSLLIETDPGIPVTTSFQVLNNGSDVEHLKVTLLKFDADQSGNSANITEFLADDDYKDWMSISPSSFDVSPASWKTLSATFSPPPNAALSYYYALMVSRQVNTKAGNGETAVVGAPALLALTTVRSPLAKQELQLQGFTVSKRVFEFLPVEFSVTVENTGNIHLAPIGNIFVNDATGADVGQLYLNKSNGLILPGSTRTYTLPWNIGFPVYEDVTENGQIVLDAKGQPKKKLNWDLSKANLFRFGKFEGHLVFIYDNGDRDIPTEATVSFWVIPWRILLVVLVVVTLVILGVVLPVVALLRKVKRSGNGTQK